MPIPLNRSRSLLLFGLCAAGIPLLPPFGLFPLGIFCVGMVLGFFLLQGVFPEDRPFLLHLYWAGFLIRCALSLICFTSALGHEEYTWGFLMHNDGVGYSDGAWQIALRWRSGIPFDPDTFIPESGTIGLYDYWNAWIYFWTGRNPLVMFFLNSLLGALCIPVTYLVAGLVAGRRPARTAALFTAFWPSLILWSTQNLKDTPICLAILLYVYAFIKVRKMAFGPLDVMFLCGSAAVLYLLRGVILPQLCLIATPLALIFASSAWHRRSRFAKITIILMMCGLSLFTMGRLSDWLRSRYLDIDDLTISEWIHYSRKDRTWKAGSTIFEKADLSSPGRIAGFLPLGILIALFAPFPWQVANFSQISAIPEMFIFYFLLPKAWRGFWWLVRYRWREAALMSFFSGIILVFMGLFEGNSGTIFRHRSMILCFYFVLVAAGSLYGKGQGPTTSPSPSGRG